jgi:hypothetical protein
VIFLFFIYFIRHWRKEIIKSPHNHAILCLLLASFIQKTTDVSFVLFYLRWDVSIQQTDTLCVSWNWFDYALMCCPLHLLAWFCIERHLFVFHSQMMQKKWNLIICSIYAPSFYVAVIFFRENVSYQCLGLFSYALLLLIGYFIMIQQF